MATVKDPICGKDVDTLRARAVGIFGGQTFYFCSKECKAKYVDPRKAPRAEPAAAPKLEPAKLKLEPAKPKAEPAKPKAEPPKAKVEPAKPEVEPRAEVEPAKPTSLFDEAVKKPARKDPSFEELPPMEAEPAGGELELPDLTPAKPRKVHSPSVIAEIQDMKKESRRWAVIIVILAALVVAAVVLSLRN